ncbi:MAG: GntG family PLP-dependent aldolase [Mycobacteriales bacterium]
MIELRSDTCTLPTRAMRRAMVTAPLGDDGYGEDPTVGRLERLAADRLGKEAACLLPSGTMANLTALLAHCPRGSTAVVGTESDIYLYEAAGASVVGAIGYLPVPNQPDGTLALPDLAAAFPEDPDDPQFALPAVVCLESPQNRCGGIPLPLGYLREVADLAHARGVALHLDGARVFNAAVALGVPAERVAEAADSVQFCLSKGLSAPIGSVVAGTAELVGRVRRVRKMLGGGMRQAGVVAAAGIVALEQMVDRLADDHANARRLAQGLARLPGISLDPPEVPTNIVLFRVEESRWDWPDLVAALGRAGVAVAGFGHGRIRAVTHSGVSRSDVDRAVEIVGEVLRAGRVPLVASAAGQRR